MQTLKSVRQVSVGIIGTGWGVNVQVPAFRAAGWHVGALCARTAEKAQQLGQQLGIPFVTNDPLELINHPSVDLVTVVLPPHMHESLSVAALRAGKHVLCDKPTCLNAEEALRMLNVAKEYPQQLSLLDFELRFLPTWKEAKNILQSNKIGKVFHVAGEFLSKTRLRPNFYWWWDKEKGGGLLGALGTHMFDNVSWLLGQRIVAVNSSLRTVVKERPEGEVMRQVTADDACSMQLRFADGTTGDFTMNAYVHGPPHLKKWQFVFMGENGTLYLDFQKGELEAYNASDECIAKMSLDAPPEGVPANCFGHGTYLIAESIKAHLVSDTSLQEVKDSKFLYDAATFEDGLYVQKVVDACAKSSQQGGVWVDV